MFSSEQERYLSNEPVFSRPFSAASLVLATFCSVVTSADVCVARCVAFV